MNLSNVVVLTMLFIALFLMARMVKYLHDIRLVLMLIQSEHSTLNQDSLNRVYRLLFGFQKDVFRNSTDAEKVSQNNDSN